MIKRRSRLHMLRQERHPLVALTALAFATRLCLLVLASALTPDAAAAAGLTGLCQPSGQEQSVPSAHDTLACQCGPVCAHGCGLGSCLAARDGHPEHTALAGGSRITRHALHHAPASHRLGAQAIRAPPLSLI
ncbi:MAG: hypothetical protein Tsb0019_15230 [Roseibium sp.]